MTTSSWHCILYASPGLMVLRTLLAIEPNYIYNRLQQSHQMHLVFRYFTLAMLVIFIEIRIIFIQDICALCLFSHVNRVRGT